MSKMYRYGLVVGRFQPLHNGHVSIIKNALDQCQNVIVLIGSAQESGTKRNPFSAAMRKLMIEETFRFEIAEKKLIVATINDLSADPEHDINEHWGSYLLETANRLCIGKATVGCIFSGNEEIRNNWFSNIDIPNVSQVFINRNIIDISATELRELMRTNYFSEWSQYTPTTIHKYYDILREQLLLVYKENNNE